MSISIKVQQVQNVEWSKTLFLSIFTLFLIVGYFSALYFPVIWNETDDIAMKRIVSGYFTEDGSPYIIFSNIIWGLFLKYLYKVDSDIQWYSWVFIFLYQFVNSIIVFLSFRKGSFYLNFFFVLIIFYFQLLFFNLEYQFTIIASLCALSGYLLFIFAIKEYQTSPLWFIISYFMLICSFIIREHSFYLISLLLFFQVVAVFVSLKIRFKFHFLIPVLLVILAIFVHRIFYNIDDWSSCFEFQKYRSSIVDNHNFTYKSLSSEMGWSKVDFEFIQSHQYECTSKFSIANYKKFYDLHYKNKDYFSNLSEMSLSSYKFNIVIVLAISLLSALVVRSRYLYIHLCSYLFVIVLLLLLSKDIRIPERVILPVFLASACFIIYSFQNKISLRFNKWSRLLPLLIFCFIFYKLNNKINNHLSRVKLFDQFYTIKRNTFFSFFNNYSNKHFILISLSSGVSKVLTDFRVFEKQEQYFNQFTILPRGWLSNSLIQKDFAKRFEITAVQQKIKKLEKVQKSKFEVDENFKFLWA